MTPKRARDPASGDAPSAKRQQQRRTPSNSNSSNSNSSNTRLSAGDDDLARLQQETLRISNEMLRSENEQLQVELEILEESNKKLEKKVTSSQERVQVLEGDLTRWYRTQKRDAEFKQAEHAAEVSTLQDQLDALLKHSGLTPRGITVTDAVESALPIATAVSPKTTQEVDAFLATCMQWQANLTTASVNLEKQVSKIEESEIASVLSNVVAQAEISAREDQVAEKERECEAMRLAMLQQQRELELAWQKMKQERIEADAFEALERRIIEDRVAELEVQLAQNRLREFEKDEEITNLRAEQDELSASSCVIPKTEWEAHLAEHQRLGEEADEWRHKCETQSREVTRLQDELRAANSRLQEAEGRLQSVQALGETRAFEALEKRILEERIEELETQLQSQQQRPQVGEEVQVEQEQQLVKLAEDLEAAQLQLSVAEAESHVKKNEVARLLNDKAELKRQVKALAADLRKVVLQVEDYKTQVGAEQRRSSQLVEEIKRLLVANKESAVQQDAQATDEHAKLQQEIQNLKEQEQHLRAQNAGEQDAAIQRLERKAQEQVSREITQLEQLNAQPLADQQEAKKRNAAQDASTKVREEGDSSGDAQSPRTVESTEELARLVHEKRAMQDFFRCYFETAEKKCRQLLHELSQREAQSAYERQQAKDSCELLRKCAQRQQQHLGVDDSSVHRAILEAVSTLERIS
ncbi:hypothetical protein Gpo141_00006023 [Globisporangium polare]